MPTFGNFRSWHFIPKIEQFIAIHLLVQHSHILQLHQTLFIEHVLGQNRLTVKGILTLLFGKYQNGFASRAHP